MCLNLTKRGSDKQDACISVAMCYLIGVVHEVDWDAEWQRMVVGVPQQDGDDLHA